MLKYLAYNNSQITITRLMRTELKFILKKSNKIFNITIQKDYRNNTIAGTK